MSYEDIIQHPHHVSEKHPRMSMLNRAAQFAPFAALTGHSAAVRETERRTQEEAELDEDHIAMLNEKLESICRKMAEHPQVSVTYFVPDERKAGGAYRTACAAVKKLDEFSQELILEDETRIPLRYLLEIDEAEPELI